MICINQNPKLSSFLFCALQNPLLMSITCRRPHWWSTLRWPWPRRRGPGTTRSTTPPSTRWPTPSSSCPPGRRRRGSCWGTPGSSDSMTAAAISPPVWRSSHFSSSSWSSSWPRVGQVNTNTNTQMPTNVFLSKMIFLIDGLPNENMLSMRIMQGFYCCLGDFCLQHSAQCNGNVDLQFFATRKLFKQNVFAINISTNDKYLQLK